MSYLSRPQFWLRLGALCVSNAEHISSGQWLGQDWQTSNEGIVEEERIIYNNIIHIDIIS